MTEPRRGNDVALFHDPRTLEHEPDPDAAFVPGRLDTRVRQLLSDLQVTWKYPEHPGRISAVLNLLERGPVPGVRVERGRAATREELGRVHTSSHVDNIFELRGQSAWLDVDTTAVSPGSVDAAEVAAGTAIAAVEAVVRGEADSSFALVRPPGHHAEPARARGFCLFNNVAVAAAHATAALGCERVLIVDWDAHHGNGTQDIFWAEPDVLVFDIHRSAPFYPGSGMLEDIGVGLGEGTTVNVPLPGGSGDVAYLRALREILVPVADAFRPDLVLVSAGFDAHWYDLALNVSYAGFAAMTEELMAIAESHCDSRLAFVLEGGYNLESLAQGVRAVLATLAGEPATEPDVCGVAEVAEAAAFHRSTAVPTEI